MGFAQDIHSCAVLRFVAGLVSSSTAVTSLTMIGDISETPAQKAKNIAWLALIAFCGSVGPVVQGMVSGSLKAYGQIWQKYPILSSQIACGSVMLVIAVTVFILLEEVCRIQCYCITILF